MKSASSNFSSRSYRSIIELDLRWKKADRSPFCASLWILLLSQPNKHPKSRLEKYLKSPVWRQWFGAASLAKTIATNEFRVAFVAPPSAGCVWKRQILWFGSIDVLYQIMVVESCEINVLTGMSTRHVRFLNIWFQFEIQIRTASDKMYSIYNRRCAMGNWKVIHLNKTSNSIELANFVSRERTARC